MRTEHYTFADNVDGLEGAWELTVHLRRFGHKTRLATLQITPLTVVQTVIAIPPARPTRTERGCTIGDRHV